MSLSYYILLFLLLYFIILNNSYCDVTSNIILDHVIVVHFRDGFTS